jgi:hypothetical protein
MPTIPQTTPTIIPVLFGVSPADGGWVEDATAEVAVAGTAATGSAMSREDVDVCIEELEDITDAEADIALEWSVNTVTVDPATLGDKLAGCTLTTNVVTTEIELDEALSGQLDRAQGLTVQHP